MKNCIYLSVLFFVNIDIFISFCGEVNSSLSFVVVDLGDLGGSDLKTENNSFLSNHDFWSAPLHMLLIDLCVHGGGVDSV